MKTIYEKHSHFNTQLYLNYDNYYKNKVKTIIIIVLYNMWSNNIVIILSYKRYMNISSIVFYN